MRRAALVVLAVAGCAADPCASAGSDVCLALRLEGSVGALDALIVNVSSSGGAPRTARTGTLSPPTIALPVEVPVRLPGATAGELMLEVIGERAQAGVARGTATVRVPPRTQRVKITLVGGAVPDLAEQVDLAGVDLSQRPTYVVSGFASTAAPTRTTSTRYRLRDDGFEPIARVCGSGGYCVTGGIAP